MVLETLESPLDCKEIQPVHPKGNQSWIFSGRTDADAETLILWPPDAKRWLIGKDPDAGKDWRQEEKGTTEGEMVGWHHRLNGHEFEQTPEDGEGQGNLACCGPWGWKDSGMTEGLSNNTYYESNFDTFHICWGQRAPFYKTYILRFSYKCPHSASTYASPDSLNHQDF